MLHFVEELAKLFLPTEHTGIVEERIQTFRHLDIKVMPLAASYQCSTPVPSTGLMQRI